MLLLWIMSLLFRLGVALRKPLPRFVALFCLAAASAAQAQDRPRERLPATRVPAAPSEHPEAATPAQPESSAVLRPDPGMHVTAISRIATDATGRLVLTCSADKTARLWRINDAASRAAHEGMPEHELLRTLRPPIGEGEVGKLFACDLSPNGALAAVAGWTAGQGEQECIYVFDTTTGRLRQRLPGLPNVVNDLAFSPGGDLLAAALAEGGLRIYDLASGAEWGRDEEYRGGSDSVAWDGRGDLRRCATTCHDGWVRLYRLPEDARARFGQSGPRRLQPSRRIRPHEGGRPFSLAFSPEGLLLAVGFSDRPALVVLDGESLEVAHVPGTKGVTNGDLGVVGWMPGDERDGLPWLVAGGSLNDGKQGVLLRLWPEAGGGKAVDLAVARDTMMDLRALPGGGLLWASADPAWGCLARPAASHAGTGWESRTLGMPPIADFRDAGATFRLSADARVVEFPRAYGGRNPARFDLAASLLSDPPVQAPSAEEAPLHPPRQEGLPLTQWRHSPQPLLAGRPLPMAENDVARSLAIAPGSSHFVLGTEWNLRAYSARGEPLWERPAPGPAYAVNLSGDGSLAVAAYGDGTLRWHDVRQGGKELLVFFPHATRERWMAWNASGYYDCSPEAEAFLGWHLNQGPGSAAEFIPAAKFRDRFYRPDVIHRLPGTRDLAEALREANEAAGRNLLRAEPMAEQPAAPILPPVVELATGGALGELELAADAQVATVAYRLRTPEEAPVTTLRVLLDGRPADLQVTVPAMAKADAASRELAAAGSLELPLAPGVESCTIALLAGHAHATSEPALLRVKRQVPPPPSPPAPPTETATASPPVPSPSPVSDPALSVKPTLYLLSIGVSDYLKDDYLPDLAYAAKDARDFAAVYEKQQGGLFGKVETKLLTDAEATAGNILDGLEWIKRETTSKDVAVLFIAGHGENNEEMRYHFCPHDYDHKSRMRTGVSMENIQITVSGIAGKVLLFVDTCHAGNALGTMTKRSAASRADLTAVVNELSSAENGAVVFASCTGRQQSVEDSAWENGAFTEALLEGLGGKADLLGTGKITVSTLEAFIAERVKQLTEGSQTPTVAKPQTIADFPVAVKLDGG